MFEYFFEGVALSCDGPFSFSRGTRLRRIWSAPNSTFAAFCMISQVFGAFFGILRSVAANSATQYIIRCIIIAEILTQFCRNGEEKKRGEKRKKAKKESEEFMLEISRCAVGNLLAAVERSLFALIRPQFQVSLRVNEQHCLDNHANMRKKNHQIGLKCV